MANQEDLLTHLDRVLASFDVPALEALANRGLVRRAQKDLEQETAPAVERQPDALVVVLGDARVTMPSQGPTAARCTCPATSVCRHILTATLFLKTWLAGQRADPDRATAVVPPGSARAEVLALTLDELRQWAGSKVLRNALRLLVAGLAVTATEDPALVLYLPTVGVECRFIPGTGIDGVLTNAPARERTLYVVAAVLAFQKAAGVVHELPESVEVLAEAESAPRSRSEVLAAARRLCADVVHVGLTHLSPAVEERLTTLAVSATGVHLPRLAGELRTLGDEVAGLASRAAHADAERLFAGLSRAYALATALERCASNPPPSLVGQHRMHYTAVGPLDLAGVGAHAWRTSSGFAGLTVYFWDSRGQQWFAWSDARPLRHSAGFDPVRRYRLPGPWEETTPEELARRRCRLQGARRSPHHRLSSTRQCRALLAEPTQPEQLDFGPRQFTDWAILHAHAARIQRVGLQEGHPLDGLVVLRPAQWAARTFDPVGQTFRWALLDAEHRVLVAELRYDALTRPAIVTLEQLDPAAEGAWGLLGQLSVQPGGLVVVPLVLYRAARPGHGTILSLGLDQATTTPVVQPEAEGEAQGEESDTFDPDAGDASPVSLPAMLERTLAGVEDTLLHLAESGCAALRDEQRRRLADHATALRQQELRLLADAVASLPEAAGAEALLRVRYLGLLHRQLAVRSLVARSQGAGPGG